MLELGATDFQWLLVFAVLLVTSLITNILLLWTVIGSRSCNKPTNVFMFNLGIVNFLQVSVFVPIYAFYVMRGSWDLGDEICKIYQFFPRFTSSVGALSLLALTSHVYFSGISHAKIKGKKKCLIVLGVLLPWMYGFGISFPWAWYSKANYGDCRIRFPKEFPLGIHFDENIIIYHWINTMFIYFVPIVAIFSLIVSLMVHFCKTRSTYFSKIQRTHRSITMMTIITGIIYIICSLPFTLVSTYILHNIHHTDLYILSTVLPATVFVEHVQTTLRPLLFFAFNPDLRRDFRIACKCSCVDDEQDDWDKKNGEAPLFVATSIKEY